MDEVNKILRKYNFDGKQYRMLQFVESKKFDVFKTKYDT